MNLFYHRSVPSNVGDDLNAVLWPRLLPEYEHITVAEWLVGAGTIIDSRLQALPGRKLVLGAGCRPGTRRLGLAADTEFVGVRGRLSSAYLGLPDSAAACDPAFVVSRWTEYKAPRGDSVGLVPHIYSEGSCGIVAAAQAGGLEVISPRLAPDLFLRRLARCARVYCESLHGAILAEALGVPWVRVRISAHYYEGAGVSDFKWRDAFSILGRDTAPMNVLGLAPIKRSWPAMAVVMQPVQVLAENRLAGILYRMRDSDVFRLSSTERLAERVDDFMRRVEIVRRRAEMAMPAEGGLS